MVLLNHLLATIVEDDAFACGPRDFPAFAFPGSQERGIQNLTSIFNFRLKQRAIQESKEFDSWLRAKACPKLLSTKQNFGPGK